MQHSQVQVLCSHKTISVRKLSSPETSWGILRNDCWKIRKFKVKAEKRFKKKVDGIEQSTSSNIWNVSPSGIGKDDMVSF